MTMRVAGIGALSFGAALSVALLSSLSFGCAEPCLRHSDCVAPLICGAGTCMEPPVEDAGDLDGAMAMDSSMSDGDMMDGAADGEMMDGAMMMDAGPEDAGPEDAGPEDAGPEDTGPSDAGTDAGDPPPADSGLIIDAAGLLDAVDPRSRWRFDEPIVLPPMDAGTDAGTDTGPTDAGTDAGTADAGTDTGPADAGISDAGTDVIMQI